MNLTKRMSEIYSAAPPFVVFSVGFVIIELAVMWQTVPSAVIAIDTQQESVISSLFGDDGVVKTSSDLAAVIEESLAVSSQLDNDPARWQRPPDFKNPCSRFVAEVTASSTIKRPSKKLADHQRLLDITDRAIFELELSSIMSGKKALANISGRIYQQGDTVIFPSLEVAFVVKEVRAESVILDLIIDDDELREEYGSIERNLFLTNNSSGRFAGVENNK